MTSVPQEAKELISESLLLTILSRFLECIPDLACILDANGKIMCHNQQFGCVILQPDAKTECSKDDQPVSNNDSSDSIYSHFNCKSFDVLREGIVAAVNEKKISYHISLTHKYNSASTMSWSVKAIDSVGINDMVLMMGYEKKRTSISQCLAQLGGFNGKITPTSPSRPYIRSPVIRDDVIYVLRRQSTNKELGKESELVEYGEEQMRRRLITASRRSSNTTLRNLISERDQLHDIMGKKQTFVRSIAHEIRTPLNVVIAGLLILDLEFPENHPNVLVRQTLDTMKISSQDAIDTIGDFITYEKMSSNILKPDKATRNFYGTVAKCIRPFYLQAQTLQIDLLYSNEDKMGPCPVEIDEYKINQVIRNLVSNAIKFSPPYSEVRISVKKVHSAEKGERIRLEVMDSGPGISEANQKKLFNEIVQFNPGELQGGGGSGLGLWISKRIVDMHDGTIGIDSAGEGFGSTFFVELPTIFGHLANKTELTDSETDSLIEVSALGTTQYKSCFRHLRLLIVDDAILVRKMTRQLLKVYGVDDTDEACNGAEAIAKVQMAMSAGQSFDGILMDSSMRVMGGPEATQLIRELGYTGKIYGVTGDADETSLAEFLGRGADRIIPKPMTKDSLCLILGELVALTGEPPAQ